MKKTESTVAILFADIAQSTRLYDILGDETAQQLIGTCLDRLTDVVTRHHGTVIKTIGDEVMCVFPEIQDAAEAARAAHEALEERFSVGADSRFSPNLHVGVHAGTVIHQENDVFGDAVNVAARLVKLSKARQILCSRDVVDALQAPLKASVRSLGRIPVRGKGDELSIFELIWEEYDMTIIADQALDLPNAAASMELRFQDHVLRVGPSKSSVTFGRDKGNDLVLPGSHVSRAHARIELLAGKFLLSDQSSNGTYVSFLNGESILLRRDKVVLYGSGSISPGVRTAPDSPAAIRFRETT